MMRNSLILAALLAIAAPQAHACTITMTMTNDAGTPTVAAPITIADTNCVTTQAAYQASYNLPAPGQPASTAPDQNTVNLMAAEAAQNMMAEVQRIQASHIQPMATSPAQ